jgi:hypothetical protein
MNGVAFATGKRGSGRGAAAGAFEKTKPIMYG